MPFPHEGQGAFELSHAAGNRLYALTPADRFVVGLDLDRGIYHGDQEVPIAADPTNVPQDLLVLDARGALLVFAQGARKLVSLGVDGSVFSRAPISTNADLMRAHRWPGSPNLVLVAGTVPPGVGRGRRSELMFYDIDAERFRPGAWDVGPGIITRIEEDASGQIGRAHV